MKHDRVHPDFALNGTHFSFSDLREVGYSLVKEGLPHEQLIGDFLLDWTHDSPTVSVKTSGSTGIPKDILLQKRYMINSALATGDFFGLTAGDRALLCLPSNYIAGKMMLVRAMVLGLKLDYVEPHTQPLLEVRKTYDFCAMVPMQLQASLKQLYKLRKLIVGGAPIGMALHGQLQRQKTQIFETYGMTETSTHIAAKKVNMVDRGVDKAYFKTLPNITVSQDKRNCLVIEAPSIFDGKIVTNDVVKLVSETGFHWLGRHDNVINSGGVKLFPEQIEAKLTNLITSRYFVGGIPDEQLGEKLVLVIEGKGDVEKIKESLANLKGLERFEHPKEIYFMTSFSETNTKKILRKKNIELLLQ